MTDSGEERPGDDRPVDIPPGEPELGEVPTAHFDTRQETEPSDANSGRSSPLPAGGESPNEAEQEIGATEPSVPSSAVAEETALVAERAGSSPTTDTDRSGNTPGQDSSSITVELEPQPSHAESLSESQAEGVLVEAGGDLEELTLPSSIEPLAPLPAGALLGPDERVRVEGLRATRGRVNVYSAQWRVEAQTEQPVDLIEGPADVTGLQRQAELLSQIHYAMLPVLHASWVADGRRYLVLDRTEGATLQDAFQTGMTADAVVSVVLQMTQALRRLQAAGWAVVALSPDGVVMGDPIRLVGLGAPVRIGEIPDSALQISGYSAPELALPVPITGKEDVYTLGALLYRGLAGIPLEEEGPELAGLSSAIHVPGAPQLLALALAPAEERVDLDGFYRRLLQFKRRVASASLALRIAAGTTIGLNSTRVTNEDACGHISWSSAYEGSSAFNALLCVVDGMGGMEAGEVASTAALRAVLSRAASYAADAISAAPGSDGVEDPSPSGSLDPKGLVQAAAEAVYGAARGRQVGATITCVAIEDGVLQLAHVGDTRAYLVRHGTLTQLTRDHSLVAAMVSSGVITVEEARGHPESNKVLRSLGGQRTLSTDYIDGLEQAYAEPILHLQPDDLVLLCSDGVWGQVEDDQLLHLCDSPDPETAVQAILQASLDAGAPDNASVVIARCYALTPQ